MSKASFAKVWLSDPSAWPVIFTCTAAVGLCVSASARFLVKSPDVQWNKHHRQSTIRENVDEGRNWISHKTKIAYKVDNDINQFNQKCKVGLAGEL